MVLTDTLKNSIKSFLFLIALGTVFLSCHAYLSARELLIYEVITRGKRVGTVEYVIEKSLSFIRYTSYLVTQNGHRQRDGEFWLTHDGKPILSRKWFLTVRGETFLEARYQGKGVELLLRAPQGVKRTRVTTASPIIDFESLPFCKELWEGQSHHEPRVFYVFIPVSGMIWKGKRQIVAESETEITVRFTVAGEVMVINYTKGDPFPREVRFLERGYSLRLHSFLGEGTLKQ